MNKKAFTLIELAIVVSIIGLVYLLGFSNFVKPKKIQVKVESLKTYLYNVGYENKVALICLKAQDICLVYADDIYVKEIDNPFDKIQNIYQLNRDRKRVYYDSIPLNESLEEVSLYLIMDKYKQHNNILIETENKLYECNSAYRYIKEFNSLNEFIIEQEKMISEVKNAF